MRLIGSVWLGFGLIRLYSPLWRGEPCRWGAWGGSRSRSPRGSWSTARYPSARAPRWSLAPRSTARRYPPSRAVGSRSRPFMFQRRTSKLIKTIDSFIQFQFHSLQHWLIDSFIYSSQWLWKERKKEKEKNDDAMSSGVQWVPHCRVVTSSWGNCCCWPALKTTQAQRPFFGWRLSGLESNQTSKNNNLPSYATTTSGSN